MMSETKTREEIHQIISAISPLDQIEQDHINFVLHWIESGSEIFRIKKPATPDIHLVAYFVVVSREMDRILLVDHKKARLWLPAGGHVEPGEHPKETVRREAMEELGIESEFVFDEPVFLSVTKTVGDMTLHNTPHTDVSLWYVIKADPLIDFDYDVEEFNQIRWFNIDEIPFKQSDPHMERFMRKIFVCSEK